MSFIHKDMLTSEEIRRILGHLGLTQIEAAQLLGVTPRTVRRWLEGDELPGPAEQALRAWLRLAVRHAFSASVVRTQVSTASVS